MKFNLQPKYLEKGYLSSMLHTLLNKGKVDKLENGNLTQLATILASFAHSYDPYKLLFEDDNQEMVYGKQNKYVINTKDLASFVLMDHMFTRGYFSKTAGRNAMSDTSNCQGVPLLFEGCKRLYNIKYSSWLKGVDLSDREQAVRVDIWLPAQLGTYSITSEGWEPGTKHGLLAFTHNKVSLTDEIIQELRTLVPNWETAVSPRMIKINEEELLESNPDLVRAVQIYNNSTHKMRNMILRGWVWSEVCRNSSMICDWNNWDEMPKKFNELAGLPPKAAGGQEAAIENFLGIKL